RFHCRAPARADGRAPEEPAETGYAAADICSFLNRPAIGAHFQNSNEVFRQDEGELKRPEGPENGNGEAHGPQSPKISAFIGGLRKDLRFQLLGVNAIFTLSGNHRARFFASTGNRVSHVPSTSCT